MYNINHNQPFFVIFILLRLERAGKCHVWVERQGNMGDEMVDDRAAAVRVDAPLERLEVGDGGLA